MSVAELFDQAKELTPYERKELAKLLIDSLAVQQPVTNTPDEHWGQSLVRLLDELGPIEMAKP